MTRLGAWKMAGAVLVLCIAAAIPSSAQTLTTLVSFGGRDGAGPGYANLVQGIDGAFYGTAFAGGENECFGPPGCGTAFKISQAGKLATLDLTTSTGYNPAAGLLLATNGDFYGTATNGGRLFGGAIFTITKAAKVSAFYSFCAVQPNCADGDAPEGALVQAANGDFYGTTGFDGINGHGGTVFKITAAGTLTTLYSFCTQSSCTDGAEPYAALVQGTDGNFYGTTVAGGVGSECFQGCGTVFKVTPTGTLTTLYSFCTQSSCTDGAEPYAALVQGTDGNFYGTTVAGGVGSECSQGCGTVFKVTPTGTLTTLYRFCTQTNCADGRAPSGALLQATDGNFYGTTEGGGIINNNGTIFEINAAGALTTLHNFDGADGSEPLGGLMQATNGNFYGTTSYGGKLACNNGLGCGTVFSLDTGLAPFVALMRNPAKVGQSFGILGQGFTGTTAVSLNGTPATFTVKSDTFIEATVPPGATTGYVTVTTPSGMLTSNVPFHVIP